jgi:hypothetical protein
MVHTHLITDGEQTDLMVVGIEIYSLEYSY